MGGHGESTCVVCLSAECKILTAVNGGWGRRLRLNQYVYMHRETDISICYPSFHHGNRESLDMRWVLCMHQMLVIYIKPTSKYIHRNKQQLVHMFTHKQHYKHLTSFRLNMKDSPCLSKNVFPGGCNVNI